MAERQKQILTCLAVGINNRENYPPHVRNFCIGLKNVSPAAYRFFRNEFSNRIPTEWTISKWHTNSDLNTEPGILKQSLEMLKLKIVQLEDKKLIGALSFDEMSIHKMVQCVNGEMIGYEKLSGIDRKTARLATQALVFLFNGINVDIQLPVAYYFIASSETEEKSILLKQVINALLECGVILSSITFDGHKTNPKICRDFGADLDVFSNNFCPSFMINGYRIRDIFDPSHMQKLVRSTLASNEMLYDSDKNPIKWVYFKRLLSFKDKLNLGSSVKISQAHIDYGSRPMKVKYAVELLSASNANMMEKLMNQGYAEFEGAGPLIKFIRIFNDIFDVFNSTSDSKENILKKTMNSTNAPIIFELFDEATEYIKGLFIRSPGGRLVPLVTSSFKTAFQGYIINMHNLKDMYNDFVINQKLITHIRTHKLSQDHLEVTFGKVRSLCGSNNNPNCQQFSAALKKLLANTAIQYSTKGNCTVVEPHSHHHHQTSLSNISKITSRPLKSQATINTFYTLDEMEVVLQHLSEIQESSNTTELNDLTDANTADIASMIENSIEKDEFFQIVFQENEKVPDTLLTINTRKICQSTFDICKAANPLMNINILKCNYEQGLIFQTILSSLNINALYSNSSFEDFSVKSELAKNILQQYIRIKSNYIAKKTTMESREKNLRHKLTRTVINYNQ